MSKKKTTNKKATAKAKPAVVNTDVIAHAPAPKPAPTRTRGVCLIALGNPEYGRLAYNLVLSIRAYDAETPVALVCNTTAISHLTEAQQAVFSHIIICPTEYYMHNNKPAYVKPKVYLDVLSPFDNTLFIDSDVAMMPGKPVRALLDELQGLSFTIKNTGRYNIQTGIHEGNQIYGYGGWEKPKLPELAATYGITDGYFYQVQGECFYFEKSKDITILFEAAKRAFTDQQAFIQGGFAGQNMNDELAFIIALAYVGMTPHQIGWLPTWWYLLEGNPPVLDRTRIIGDFWMLSAGGNNLPNHVMKFYDDIIGAASNRLKLPHLFKVKKKSTYLLERKLF